MSHFLRYFGGSRYLLLVVMHDRAIFASPGRLVASLAIAEGWTTDMKQLMAFVDYLLQRQVLALFAWCA